MDAAFQVCPGSPVSDPVAARSPRVRRRWVVGGIIAAVVVLGGAVGLGLSLSGSPATTNSAQTGRIPDAPTPATDPPPSGSSRAGSYPSAVPAAEGTCADPGRATPLIFVHGLNGSPADFTGQGTPSLASTLTALPGVAASYFDYRSYASDWVTDPHIGPALASDIACLADTSAANGGPGKVIVVAHSMGGLALRYAAAQRVGGRSVAARIGLAVTVAAPNTGSWIDGTVNATARGVGGIINSKRAASQIIAVARTVCATSSRPSGAPGDIAGLCGLILSPDSPAGQALVPGSAQLDALAPLPASVPLFAAAGDIDLTTGALAIGPVELPTGLAIPVDVGDLLVTPASALAEADHPGPFSGRYTDTCQESLQGLAAAAQAGTIGCSHGALLHSPPLTAAVLTDVRAYLRGA